MKILLDPSGNVLSCITGYMAGGHPDYVVVEIRADEWRDSLASHLGVAGGDFPADMEIDAAGDVYVTGIGIDFIDKYSTIKLRGSDGQLCGNFTMLSARTTAPPDSSSTAWVACLSPERAIQMGTTGISTTISSR